MREHVVRVIEFDTERLRLRQWCQEDRSFYAQLNRDPQVMAYFPAPLSRAESDAMADRCEAFIAERGWGLWAVELKESGQFIGSVGLNIPTATLPFTPCVEIGWRLAFSFWGKGLAHEAATRVLQAGFEQLALPEIVSFTALINLRSQAVMERLGMERQKPDFDHPSVAVGHPLRKHCWYRLTREQWITR
ncbi:GNAT family N-acetyltransferase [Yersinia nurmii]|uniref:Acetyl transferase n=1 Tax=Yersinia nurmii TaxID=685706 RepID=A0AAW7JZS7_9GAMM|nr:GNAT family N-acetyltransferase [Yersinia nurmii]MDN0087206.1 GNAT family N-acetyltransferase [Yersinia nurmii]CNE97472.1 putative acetyl transferase [Yersinia nurmii]